MHINNKKKQKIKLLIRQMALVIYFMNNIYQNVLFNYFFAILRIKSTFKPDCQLAKTV